MRRARLPNSSPLPEIYCPALLIITSYAGYLALSSLSGAAAGQCAGRNLSATFVVFFTIAMLVDKWIARKHPMQDSHPTALSSDTEAYHYKREDF
jgi:hypothetical protein